MTLANGPSAPNSPFPSSLSDDFASDDRSGSRVSTAIGSNAVNVGHNERIVSGIVGTGLIAAGLSRKSIPGLLVAGVGGLIAYRAVTGHCGTYSALGIDTSDRDTDGAPPAAYSARGIHVAVVFTIANKSPDELYAYWRDFNNLPSVFEHLERVDVLDDKRSHWISTGPLHMKFEWDAEIINDEPGQLIAWRSLAGASVDNAGSVRFLKAPADRGTELKVTLDYIPPAGVIGKTIATLIGQNPAWQIREDIRRFKWKMESGEIPTIEGQPRGSCQGC